MSQSGPGWSPENIRPGPLFRFRLHLANRAYENASQRCRRLKWEMDALKTEREAAMAAYAARREAKGTSDEPDRSDDPDLAPVLQTHWRINNKLHELAGPWRKAVASHNKARDAVRYLLLEVGFQDEADDEKERK